MIKHLVIPSGSTSGVGMLGIFKYLMENKYFKIDTIESIHASSVGTIVSIILSLDFDWKTVYDYIIERPWEKVIDMNPIKVMQSLDNKGLMCCYDLGKEFFLPLFKAKDIDIDITLQKFYEKTNIELFFYTCDISDLSCIELSHNTHPDLELVKAVAMSSALPIVFQPIEHNSKLYCDGGLINDFPLKECVEYIAYKHKIQDIDNISQEYLDTIFAIKMSRKKDNKQFIEDIKNGTLLDYSFGLSKKIFSKLRKVYTNSKILNIINFYDLSVSFGKLKKAVNRVDRIEMLSNGENVAKKYLDSE
jgi:hypothetical protein